MAEAPITGEAVGGMVAGAEPSEMGYAVSLEAFSGPLDLLLYLVRRTELDITEIPIAVIADQFVATVQEWQARGELDLEIAGDFILMAATLLEIKSRAIAPPPPEDTAAEGGDEDEELGDPRLDLIRKLLAYRRFKEAAQLLVRGETARAERAARRFREEIPEDQEEAEGIDLGELDPGALAKQWFTIVARLGGMGPRTVAKDDIPIEARISSVLAQAESARHLTLRQLFAHEGSLQGRITTLMATLEVVRQRYLEAQQLEQYGDVELRWREAEERTRVVELPALDAEEPKKRRRRPPLVTFQAADPVPAGEGVEEIQPEPFESDEERFLRELNETCDLDQVLVRAKDWEEGFKAEWDVVHPPPAPPAPPESPPAPMVPELPSVAAVVPVVVPEVPQPNPDMVAVEGANPPPVAAKPKRLPPWLQKKLRPEEQVAPAAESPEGAPVPVAEPEPPGADIPVAEPEPPGADIPLAESPGAAPVPVAEPEPPGADIPLAESPGAAPVPVTEPEPPGADIPVAPLVGLTEVDVPTLEVVAKTPPNDWEGCAPREESVAPTVVMDAPAFVPDPSDQGGALSDLISSPDGAELPTADATTPIVPPAPILVSEPLATVVAASDLPLPNPEPALVMKVVQASEAPARIVPIQMDADEDEDQRATVLMPTPVPDLQDAVVTERVPVILASPPAPTAEPAVLPAPVPRRQSSLWPVVLSATLTVLAVAVILWRPRPAVAPSLVPPLEFSRPVLVSVVSAEQRASVSPPPVVSLPTLHALWTTVDVQRWCALTRFSAVPWTAWLPPAPAWPDTLATPRMLNLSSIPVSALGVPGGGRIALCGQRPPLGLVPWDAFLPVPPPPTALSDWYETEPQPIPLVAFARPGSWTLLAQARPLQLRIKIQ